MTEPRFVVTRRIPEPALELLDETGELWVSPHDRPLEAHELGEAVRGATAIVSLLHDRIDESVLEAAGAELRCVANVAVGYDNVDVAAAADRGVVVTNTPGVLTDATADLAMALILMTTRRLGEGERLIRRGERWQWHMFFLLGSGLQGKTLGVVGLGEIGRAVAHRARAFGMEIVYSARRHVEAQVERELEASFLPLDDLLAASDVVTLHTPLTDETHHLIDDRRLRRMKPTAHLINTARGPIVDETALAEALAEGRIAGAALDVFEHEPAVQAGLVEQENAVLVPHLGSATTETRTEMALLAARNAVAVSRGEQPLTPVRP